MMDGPERNTIYRFAKGDLSLRDEAIRIFQNHINLSGRDRGDAHENFMSEIDSPCPDYALRATYRKQVIAAHEAR